jgi:serine/threonine protein phosphatase PrpC
MGGHAAGDVASRIVVNEVFRQIKILAADPLTIENKLEQALLQALNAANTQLGTVARTRPELDGMGSTLIAPIVAENRLYWISVGDSPLYLQRESRLFRLNENHSVAGLLDTLVSEGEIDADTASQHPERHCLTSVMNGSDIPHVDCRQKPFTLENGDIVIAASDGLQSIGDKTIANIIFKARNETAEDIAGALLQAVKDYDDPDQDNVSICIFKIKFEHSSAQVTSLDFDRVQKPPQGEPVEENSLIDQLYQRVNGGAS